MAPAADFVGEYRFDQVPVGRYSVQACNKGYLSPAERPGVAGR